MNNPHSPALPLFLSAFCLFCMLSGCAVKPAPLSMDEHQARVAEDRLKLYANQEPLTAPLTLDTAIARALAYNFDHHLAIMEAAFHNQQLLSANLAMLPRLALNAGYSGRSNDSASSSISYETGRESLEASYSSERQRVTGDLTLSWTILDFGLSYFQAKQQADRLLIMQERKRRVVNNMVKEVIAAYWKAITADKLLPQVKSALEHTRTALASYAEIHDKKLSPPLETLEQYRDLLNIENSLRRIQADLTMARVKLAALINVPLSSAFSIAPPDDYMLVPPPLTASVEELEDKGLVLRPDLREEAYQERIDKSEVHKEILRMLPGVSLFGGFNFDSNRFLVHNFWSEIGAKATMSLFNLITGPMQIKAANTKVEVSRTRRLAQTVAALTQIHLSYYQYIQALEDYNHIAKANRVEKQILAIAESEQVFEAESKLLFIRRSVNAVRAEIEHGRILSDIYASWGNMYFSLGGDIVPMEFNQDSIAGMSALIKEKLLRWWQGEMPFGQQ